MATKWQRFRVAIPTSLKPASRIALSRAIVDEIKERSLKNLSVNGKNKFSKLNDNYAKKKGVPKGSRANMVLNDEMIDAMELISHRKGTLLMGYVNESDENAKADGNQRGTYGTSSPIPGKARDFMGINKAGLKRALAKADIVKTERARVSKEILEGVG